MKEDNGRDKLLCFLLLDTIPSICPKIASGNARNHPPERFPSRQLLQLRGYFPSRPPPPSPSFRVFRQPFITLVTRICFRSPAPFPRAFPASINAWNPKRVAVSPPSLLPLDLYPTVKTRPTMGISETVSASRVQTRAHDDDGCSGEGN